MWCKRASLAELRLNVSAEGNLPLPFVQRDYGVKHWSAREMASVVLTAEREIRTENVFHMLERYLFHQ